ncbi:dTMP kinase [Salsuginibacillus kocurii]|uniref:dTMP kinase n=1 Tax=Salsuginibacillus kocurii TaxID=427078 RepID=UPI0003761945|nr:dTMP kinase [Salsuginibacillus kocurii]
MKKEGCFITFEGGEGAGKSTVIQYVLENLQADGYACLHTREPGGIHIAEQIRSLILDPEHTEMDGRTEALLYAAARRQHLVEKIVPALQEGKVVLCDRFVDSSLAYQGYAREIGMDEVGAINDFAIESWVPHLTLYFDLEPSEGLERVNANEKREVNRLDMEHLTFHEHVRKGYELLLAKHPDRLVKIDASQSLEQVCENVLSCVKTAL